MSRRQFQNGYQWPNAIRTRRDHPLTRDLHSCYFPVFHPNDVDLTIATTTPNQTRLSSGGLYRPAAASDRTGLRQPYSYWYVNHDLGRDITGTGSQIPINTTRSFTLLWRVAPLTDLINLGARNPGLLGGVPTFQCYNNGNEIFYRFGATGATMTVTSVAAPSPIMRWVNLGFSYHSNRRMRAYADYKFTQNTYTDSDFAETAWTHPWAFDGMIYLGWIMAWTRELSPAEIFEIYRNPAVVLAQAPIRAYSLPPVITDSINPLSIAETAAIPTPGIDIGLELNPLSISETASIPAPAIASDALTLAPASISATATIPSPSIGTGTSRGLKITISDRLAEG